MIDLVRDEGDRVGGNSRRAPSGPFGRSPCRSDWRGLRARTPLSRTPFSLCAASRLSGVNVNPRFRRDRNLDDLQAECCQDVAVGGVSRPGNCHGIACVEQRQEGQIEASRRSGRDRDPQRVDLQTMPVPVMPGKRDASVAQFQAHRYSRSCLRQARPSRPPVPPAAPDARAGRRPSR
jgi:hypothetical protein